VRIKRIEAIPVTLPLRHPMRMANKVIEASDNVLVRVETDTGLVGWGEAAAAPKLTGHTQQAIVADTEKLAEMLAGADPLHRVAHALSGSAVANSSAIAAVDIALHDVAGKALGLPVVELLGGPVAREFPVIALFGGGGFAADVAAAEAAFAAGYRWFKAKLGVSPADEDRKTLETLRESFGDRAVLTGDANTAWTPSEAVAVLGGLADVGLAFVEQPVGADDVAGMNDVALAAPMPIGVDEGIHGVSDVVAFASTAVAGISLKLIKMGGISGVLDGARTALNLGLAVNLGGKVAETSLSTAAIVHAAAALPAATWGLSVTHTTTDHDVVTEPIPVIDGVVAVPTGPGLGVEVDEARVAAIRSDR
jgi:muconate cycloisomerase